jgi:hypothetical protein
MSKRNVFELSTTTSRGVVVVMVAFLAFFLSFFFYLCGEAARARILWIVKEMRKFLRRESGRRKIS